MPKCFGRDCVFDLVYRRASEQFMIARNEIKYCPAVKYLNAFWLKHPMFIVFRYYSKFVVDFLSHCARPDIGDNLSVVPRKGSCVTIV